MILDPKWIVGFVDGEGCFHVSINRHQEMTTGSQVLPEFTIVQHQRDVKVLHAIKDYFGCGVVRKNHEDRMSYRVRALEHLNQVIVPFFDKHPLVTEKKFNFFKFKEVLKKMAHGDHLKLEGIEEIRSIKETMNQIN